MKSLAVVILNSIMGTLIVTLVSVIIYILCIAEAERGVIAYPIHPNVTITVEIPGQGYVLGNYETTMWSQQNYMQFRGIPFAESPSGNLRFKQAVPRTPWSNLHDATNFGKRCPVITTVATLTPSQLSEDLEDCLNLCVYTKNLTAKRPVMFYVYGGGYYNGSSIDHPPRHLLEKDVVVVVPQYRVGALGWATTLSPDMPGNAALGDILLALEWVQKYIHAFGGDAAHVTIFGQSAGAGVTSALLFSPQTPPNVFRHAIVQSGAIFAEWGIIKEPRAQSVRICEALNCTACTKDTEIYNCMKSAPVLAMLEVTQQETFAPTVGDLRGILPRSPYELVSNYNSSIPVMMGFTKHDGSFILASYYDALKAQFGNLSALSVRNFADGMMAGLSKTHNGLAKQLFSRMLFPAELLGTNDHKRALSAYFDLASDIYFKSPMLSLAEQLLAQNGTTYFYSFDYEGSNTRFGYEFGNEHYPFEGGVHHSNDNIYLWSTHKLNAADTVMAKKMVDIWTSFAINGKPSVAESSTIVPMNSPSGPYFHINTNITIGDDIMLTLTATVDDPESKKLDRVDIEF